MGNSVEFQILKKKNGPKLREWTFLKSRIIPKPILKTPIAENPRKIQVFPI